MLKIAVVRCGELPRVLHGKVHYLNQTSSDDIIYGFVASYTCDIGYTLLGSTTRTCSARGVWTDHSPRCDGK